MSTFKDDRIDDAYTLLNKTGNTARSAKLGLLTPAAKRIEQCFDGEVLFDVYYNGKHLESLTYTEIFSKGIMVSPCCDYLRYKLVELAAEDTDPIVTASDVLAGGNLDKYRLIKFRDPSAIPAVVFLPGTNLLKDSVDWKAVDTLVRDGAKIKLHPITSVPWRTRLEKQYGRVIINRNISGYDVLKQAERVFTTVNSEMGLLAVLMGKPLGMIDETPVPHRPIYKQIYDVVLPETNRKPLLEKILGSRKTGICWVWQDVQRIDEIVTAIKETASAYRV